MLTDSLYVPRKMSTIPSVTVPKKMKTIDRNVNMESVVIVRTHLIGKPTNTPKKRSLEERPKPRLRRKRLGATILEKTLTSLLSSIMTARRKISATMTSRKKNGFRRTRISSPNFYIFFCFRGTTDTSVIRMTLMG